MNNGSVDYKTGHLLPRLRESPDEAGGYIASNLAGNLDAPEAVALAFRDVAEAYDLPIEVMIKGDAEHERLRSAVVDAAKGQHSPAADDRWAESRLHDAVRALEDFEKTYHA